MSEFQFTLEKSLKGHGGWVTAIATTMEAPDMFLSASRDKSLIMWKAEKDPEGKQTFEWRAHKRLTGHSHFVQDVAISSDGQFALSGSCDATLRLWDLNSGTTTRRFIGHSKDVLSVAFSADNRQIVSGSRDKTINLWNTLGVCKYTIKDDEAKNGPPNEATAHREWVSCVRFSPNLQIPLIVSAGWDRVVKVWSINNYCKLRTNLLGHTGYVNTVTVSPDGSLCASGGKDGTAMLWDLNHGNHLSSLNAGDIIHALCFSPMRYWLCAATASTIKIWDLGSQSCVADLKPEFAWEARAVDKPEGKKDAKHIKATPIQCISLAWSADGSTLFAGYTDNLIRVWYVSKEASAQ